MSLSRELALHALVIEDDALIAQLIELILIDAGFITVEVVATAADAIASATIRAPDFITSDVQLHKSNGIDAVQAISEQCAAPVVFITGCPQEVHDRMPDVPVLTKPFQVSDLIVLL
jgi:CheY-like chemotaxis protein